MVRIVLEGQTPMKKIAIATIVVALAGALVYWFGFRDRGGSERRPTVAAGTADPWDAPRKKQDDGPKMPGGGGDRGGAMPKLSFEVDPDGRLLLEGQVLDEQDRPVAGAEVRISSSPARTTKTDSDGSFSFDKLLGRTYGLTARAGDKIGRTTTKVTATPEPAIIRLKQGVTVTVHVTDAADHKPIAGARVMRSDVEDDEVKTGADGKAVLRGFDEGWMGVTAVADGYGPSTSNRRLGGDKQTTIDLALSRGAAVSGRVVDEKGAAVAGVRVWAMEAANAWEGGAGERLAVTTDKEGAFRIPALAAGSYLLFAKDEVHAPAVTAPLQVSGDSPTTGVTIVMKDAAVLAGVVVAGGDGGAAEGKPVPYATVKIASKRWSADMTYRQAAADDQGRFEIKGLPRQALRLRAEGEEASSAAVDVDLEATPVRRDLRLVLDVTGSIAGIVVDDNGEPIAEATVHGFPDFLAGEIADGDFVMASNGTATTDGGGRFVLRGLEKGKYRVWGSRDGGGRRRRGGRDGVKAQTGDQDVRVVLPTPGGIKGKVELEDGEPPELAIVSSDWEHRVTTRDGNFELDDLLPGKYDVRVSGQDFAEKIKGDVEVTAGKVTDTGTLTLRRGRTFSGKVVDPNGAPVQNARVVFGKMLFGDGKQTGADDTEGASAMGMKMGFTNAAGEFTLKGAPRTSGSLLAEHATIGRSVAIKIPAGREDYEGVAITLRGYGSITGRITRKGEPVAGATINAAPMGSSGQAIFVQSGQDGSFAVDKVPEGPTALTAMINKGMGASGGSKTITVVAGKPVDGSIDLPAGDLALQVKIEPKTGEKVDAAQVFLFRGNIAAQNGEEIMDAFLASGGERGADGQVTLALGGAAGMLIWLGPAMPFPTFKELLAGSYSACAIPITGTITDPQLMGRIFRHLDKLEVFCKPVTVKPSPASQEMTMILPAMKPLPAEDEE